MPLLDPFFVAQSAPAVNVAASASHAGVAAIVGQAAKLHVCQTIHATFNAGATAPAAIQVGVVLRDGASGSGAILWSSQMALTAVGGQASPPVEISGLNISGTPGNAMTLEFQAAGGANTFETVSFSGFLA